MLQAGVICLVLASFSAVSAQRPFTGSSRLRLSDTEKYFYNGLDHRIEDGWSDDRSIGVAHAYGVAFPPAQNLAQLNFSQLNAVWRIEARDQGYAAKEEDELVIRIRGEAEATPLVFFAGPQEDVEPIRHRFVAKPQWHLIHVPLKALSGPTPLRLVGLRSEAPGKATVYVAYMYLRVNPSAVVPKNKQKI